MNLTVGQGHHLLTIRLDPVREEKFVTRRLVVLCSLTVSIIILLAVVSPQKRNAFLSLVVTQNLVSENEARELFRMWVD